MENDTCTTIDQASKTAALIRAHVLSGGSLHPMCRLRKNTLGMRLIEHQKMATSICAHVLSGGSLRLMHRL